MATPIRSAVLVDGDVRITVLSMGCSIQDWQVAGRRVVLGYENPEDYRTNPCVLGSIVGRIANRTSGASFELAGRRWKLPANDGANHIHGGPQGLAWLNWDLQQIDSRHVRLRLSSPHLDQGYPGHVAFEVNLTLNGYALTWEITATPDRETPINLAQHVYFNLNGSGDILDHSVQLHASRMTPTDAALIPTGEVKDVSGTRFDFRGNPTIAQNDPPNQGYDCNFVLDQTKDANAIVTAPDRTQMRLWTDRPGLQFYTAGNLYPFGQALPGAAHQPNCGFCLEAQDFPDSMNQKQFGSILYDENRPYHQRTTVEIKPAPCG